MIVTPLGVLPVGVGQYTNITPFTYRDGQTYLQVLESMRSYIRDTLTPWVELNMGGLTGDWNAITDTLISDVETQLAAQSGSVESQLESQISEFNTVVSQIIDNSIELQEDVLNAIVTNPDSVAVATLSGYYASKTGLEEAASAIDNVSETVNTVNDTVSTGRLSTASQRDSDVRLNNQLYKPTPYALLKWRMLRDATIAGERQGHIVVVGDSISSAEGHVANPAHKNNWFGRMKNQIVRRYGESGSGIIMADRIVRATPAYDHRIAYSGAMADEPYGVFKMGAVEVSAVTPSRVYINDTADTTNIYSLSSGSGINSAHRNGVVKTFANTTSHPPVDANPTAGYQQLVTEIAWGSVVEDVIVDFGPASIGPVGSNMHLLGMENLVKKNGTFRVSNISVSGQSLNTLFAAGGSNDEVNGFYGLPMIDMVRADLLLVCLGINDWQGLVPIATLKANLTTLIRRQRSTNAGRAGGDVMLVWNPQPDLNLLQPPTQVTWEAYRQAYYDVAAAENVALVDLGLAWDGFSKGNQMGLFSDGIHPNGKGAIDMSVPIHRAVMED